MAPGNFQMLSDDCMIGTMCMVTHCVVWFWLNPRTKILVLYIFSYIAAGHFHTNELALRLPCVQLCQSSCVFFVGCGCSQNWYSIDVQGFANLGLGPFTQWNGNQIWCTWCTVWISLWKFLGESFIGWCFGHSWWSRWSHGWAIHAPLWGNHGCFSRCQVLANNLWSWVLVRKLYETRSEFCRCKLRPWCSRAAIYEDVYRDDILGLSVWISIWRCEGQEGMLAKLPSTQWESSRSYSTWPIVGLQLVGWLGTFGTFCRSPCSRRRLSTCRRYPGTHAVACPPESWRLGMRRKWTHEIRKVFVYNVDPGLINPMVV